MWLALLVLAACGGHERSAEPVVRRGIPRAEPAPSAVTAKPAPEPFKQKSPLLGSWCLQYQTVAPDGPERTLDGSTWDFRGNGSVEHNGRSGRKEGTWLQSGSKLTVSDLGEREIVELDYERMVLHGERYEHFGRDCGPELASARLVEQLVVAAGTGWVDGVEAAFRKGADLDAIDQLGSVPQTALMAAARKNNAQVVERLLRLGARTDVVGPTGETAMSVAESKGHDEVIALLRQAGVQHTVTSLTQASDPQLQPRLVPAEPSATQASGAARPSMSPREQCMHDNFDDDEAFARCERLYPAPPDPDRPPRERSHDAQLGDRFFDQMREQGREGTAQRIKEIEERLPERPGMTDEEKEDLARQRIEAFIGEP